MDKKAIERRYPWRKFDGPEHATSGNDNKFRVTWYHQSNAPGMNGWASVTRTFATAEEAAAIPAQKMGIAYKVIAQELRNASWWLLAQRER